MGFVASVTGELNHRSVAKLADSLSAGDSSGEQNLILDVSGIRFATPFPITVLAAILERHGPQHESVRLICPEDPGPLQYLAACGFLQHASEFVSVEQDRGLHRRKPSTADTVLPLTKLTVENQIPDLLTRVDRRVGQLLGDDGRSKRGVLSPIRSAIREICMNVLEHSKYEVGWIAAQQYFNRYDGVPYVEVGISDAGRGVRASLATRFPDFRKIPESEVLRKTLEDSLTRHDQPHRGTGYFVLQQASRDLDASCKVVSVKVV